MAVPPTKGRLLTVRAMRDRIASRLEGGEPPSCDTILRNFPRDKKIRVGRIIAVWEQDFEEWFRAGMQNRS